MKINIELTHEDLMKADAENIQSLFLICQSFAKTYKVGEESAMRETVNAEYDKRHKATENKKTDTPSEEPKAQTEKPFDRKEIETQIKQIALDGKDKGASKKIKECIQSYGVEKLSAVPDDKMADLLQKVQEAVQ